MYQAGLRFGSPYSVGRELTFHYHFIYYVLCYTFKPKKRTCCSFCQLPCLGLCPYSKTPNCDQLLLFSKDDGCRRRGDTEESLPLLQVGFWHFSRVIFYRVILYLICIYIHIYINVHLNFTSNLYRNTAQFHIP